MKKLAAFTELSFIASFPTIQSAIKVGQDGMRIQLDIAESEMGNAIGILAMRDKLLRITIAIIDKPTTPAQTPVTSEYEQEDV